MHTKFSELRQVQNSAQRSWKTEVIPVPGVFFSASHLGIAVVSAHTHAHSLHTHHTPHPCTNKPKTTLRSLDRVLLEITGNLRRWLAHHDPIIASRVRGNAWKHQAENVHWGKSPMKHLVRSHESNAGGLGEHPRQQPPELSYLACWGATCVLLVWAKTVCQFFFLFSWGLTNIN